MEDAHAPSTPKCKQPKITTQYSKGKLFFFKIVGIVEGFVGEDFIYIVFEIIIVFEVIIIKVFIYIIFEVIVIEVFFEIIAGNAFGGFGRFGCLPPLGFLRLRAAQTGTVMKHLFVTGYLAFQPKDVGFQGFVGHFQVFYLYG